LPLYFFIFLITIFLFNIQNIQIATNNSIDPTISHHMQKVLDFIEGVAIPGVPPASGAGTAGYVFY
jgi:hypothetical protein